MSDLIKWLTEHGEEPAFVARARAPQLALDDFLRECERQRESLLEGTRVHWTILAHRVDKQWSRLESLLRRPDTLVLFEELDALLYVNKPLQSSIWDSDRSVFRRFQDSAERFNGKWNWFLDSRDLAKVNKPRRDYNEYYVLEKTCAVGTETAVRGFVPLDLIDRPYLARHFPLLKIPE